MQLRPPCDPSILGGVEGIREPAAQCRPVPMVTTGRVRAFSCATTRLLRLFLIDNPFSTSIAAMQQLLLHYTTARLAMI
jgi:hypothetical protein